MAPMILTAEPADDTGMKRSVIVTVGLVLAGLLGLADIVTLPFGDGEHPPLAVAIAGAVLGVITLAGVVLAWRGSRGGVVAVVISRLLSALSAVPAFFADGVPGEIKVFAAVGILVTLLVVALVATGLRDRVAA